MTSVSMSGYAVVENFRVGNEGKSNSIKYKSVLKFHLMYLTERPSITN